MTIKQAMVACERHSPNESVIITHQLQRCVHPQKSDCISMIERFTISTAFKSVPDEIRFYRSETSLADCVEQFLTSEL
jgi:hypothetical protein